ncbi:hypothetical protein [Thermococcus profundus]|uniref:hypothetical protein n=1 Tax=Thermococcus profundus TaxID=49899 RepID=UPI000B59AA33|nr:hypothetical protein [Thermococcus profundus]
MFYSDGFLEVYSIWGRGGKNAVRIVADAQMVSTVTDGEDLYLLIKPHGRYRGISGVIGVFLVGARGMEPVITAAVEASSMGKGKNEDTALIDLAPSQPV